jgi:hypothetical protein
LTFHGRGEPQNQLLDYLHEKHCCWFSIILSTYLMEQRLSTKYSHMLRALRYWSHRERL